MLYVIIGIVVVVIASILLYNYSSLTGVESIFAGFLLGCIVGAAFSVVCAHHRFDYNTLPAETYELKEFQDNRYYEVSTADGSVSVYVLNDDGTYEKETYNENLVQFQEGDNAEVSIVKGKVDWSKRQKFWFSLDPVEEKLVSVTITVPIPGEIHGEFCTRCGEEIIGAGIYCSRCGEKVSGSTASDME